MTDYIMGVDLAGAPRKVSKHPALAAPYTRSPSACLEMHDAIMRLPIKSAARTTVSYEAMARTMPPMPERTKYVQLAKQYRRKSKK